MTRLAIRILTTLVLVVLTAAPAVAADPDIQLSRDGVTWGTDIDEPLFDPEMRWVPGDSETSSFFVRNNGGSLGDMTIDVIAGRAGELIDSGDLTITARGGGDWQSISEGGEHQLLTTLDIADGKVAEISVNVSFDGESLSNTEVTSAPLDFVVTLSRAASLNGIGDPNGSLSGLLPDTGAHQLTWLLIVGAIMLGCGSALVVDEGREGRRG